MASNDPLLDEIQWRDVDAVQRFGGIHENTVLYYFHESPFFDKISNNHSLFTQAVANPALGATLDTREAFESRLNQMSGLEYRVAYGPKDFGPEAYPGLGRWVIRKQNRRKQQGAPDEVKIVSTYYVIGENVYMAPSVGDVVWSKLVTLYQPQMQYLDGTLTTEQLTVTQSLNKALSVASSLPRFTPALGHHYFDPNLKSSKPTARKGSEAPSAIGSPVRGRSGDETPLPSSQSQPSGAKASPNAQSTDSSNMQSLLESFAIFRRYGKEYADTHPLVGEPGSFSVAPVKPSASLQPPGMKQPSSQNQDGGLSPNIQPSQSTTPLIKREPSAGAEVTKAEEKPAKQPDQPPKKRRKSKAPGSPSSPLSPPSASTL